MAGDRGSNALEGQSETAAGSPTLAKARPSLKLPPWHPVARGNPLSRDLDTLLAPIDEAAPAGADPAISDPLFQAVVQAAGGQTDYVFDGKDEVEIFRPPNWGEVERQVLDCLGRSRDVRLAIILARALVAETGPIGLARGLGYLDRLLADFWETAHPAPDPSESDPAERYFTRINALKLLAQSDGLPREILAAPLVEARGIGRFSLRQLQLAQGKGAPGPNESRPEPGMLRAATEKDPEIAAKRAAMGDAVTALRGIEARLAAELGTVAPDLAPLARLLDELGRALGADAMPPAEAAEPASTQPGAAAPPAGIARAAGPGGSRLGSRAEVLAALDAILAFYRTNDPSSPIPLFVMRIRRLVPMSFAELLRELAPSGLAELEHVADVEPAGPIDAPSTGPPPAAAAVPAITSRAAVVETLDAVIDFYHTREPSSPIPVLVRRIRRLVPLGFVALLQEIAPKGLAEFKEFADSEMPDDA